MARVTSGKGKKSSPAAVPVDHLRLVDRHDTVSVGERTRRPSAPSPTSHLLAGDTLTVALDGVLRHAVVVAVLPHRVVVEVHDREHGTASIGMVEADELWGFDVPVARVQVTRTLTVRELNP